MEPTNHAYEGGTGHDREQPGPDRMQTESTNVLDTAQDAFDCLVTGPGPLVIDTRPFRGLPDRRVRLDEVRRLLMRRKMLGPTRDAVWTHLVLRSRTGDPAWKVAAVGMALPALRATTADLTKRLAGDAGTDIASEVMRGFLTALAEVDVSRPRVLVRLRWAGYRAGHAAVVSTLNAPAPAGASIDAFVAAAAITQASASSAPVAPYGHPDLVLARAVADRAITRLEADLIGVTRLDQVPVLDWAADHRMPYWDAYRLRRDAEQRLVTYILATDETTPERARPVAAAKVAPVADDTTSPSASAGSRSASSRGAGDASTPAAVTDPARKSQKSSPELSKRPPKPGIRECEGNQSRPSTKEDRRCA